MHNFSFLINDWIVRVDIEKRKPEAIIRIIKKLKTGFMDVVVDDDGKVELVEKSLKVV